MSSRKIEDLLNESHNQFTPLQRLLKTSSNQKQWTAELRAFIEPPLCYEVEVTGIKGPHIYLLCTSAAAATRLRFLLPEKLPNLQLLANFKHTTDFKLRVSNQA